MCNRREVRWGLYLVSRRAGYVLGRAQSRPKLGLNSMYIHRPASALSFSILHSFLYYTNSKANLHSYYSTYEYPYKQRGTSKRNHMPAQLITLAQDHIMVCSKSLRHMLSLVSIHLMLSCSHLYLFYLKLQHKNITSLH